MDNWGIPSFSGFVPFEVIRISGISTEFLCIFIFLEFAKMKKILLSARKRTINIWSSPLAILTPFNKGVRKTPRWKLKKTRAGNIETKKMQQWVGMGYSYVTAWHMCLECGNYGRWPHCLRDIYRRRGRGAAHCADRRIRRDYQKLPHGFLPAF